MNIYVPIIYNTFVYVQIEQLLPQAVCHTKTLKSAICRVLPILKVLIK